ncbi:MAG: helix-turn-helix transcriptional regulator [Saprospiraceae bacterium]|nr:helix-turn-helix transcriptional regulator [Saprospiraceae bacterium]
MTHAGQKIKMLRDSKSWSREQLAEKVGISVEIKGFQFYAETNWF